MTDNDTSLGTAKPLPAETVEAAAASPQTKKSLYQRWSDRKTHRDVRIPDEDLKKYTGMNREQLQDWSKDRPDVAGNQAAGKLAMGQATGFGGLGTAGGYGGWGPDADGKLKFPPQPSDAKKSVDEEEEEEE